MADVIESICVSITADTAPLVKNVAAAGASLRRDLSVASEQSARIAQTALTSSFGHIADAISDAAVTGELSFRGMVNAILRDLSRLAIREFVQAPLRGVLGNLFGGLLGGDGFGGARAAGGPVQPHRAFLVGERGPELFVPGVSGQVRPQGAAANCVQHFDPRCPELCALGKPGGGHGHARLRPRAEEFVNV